MMTDHELQQLTNAGFAEVDAGWFEPYARTWGIGIPNNPIHSWPSNMWQICRLNPEDGEHIEYFERYTLAECLQIIKEFES